MQSNQQSQRAIQTKSMAQTKTYNRESKVTKLETKQQVEIMENDEFEKVVEFSKEREYGVCLIQ